MQQALARNLSIALFVGFLTWGLYTLIVYFGIPVHGAVLLEAADQNYIKTICADNEYFCRGAASLYPGVIYTFQRAAPFLWYGIISLVFYGLFIGWNALNHGDINLRVRVKPWQIFAIFLVLLWLLFTILTSMQVPQGGQKISFRSIVSPHAMVYPGVGEEGMKALEENFNRLEERGCLRQTRELRPGINEYDMKVSCVQSFFVTRVLSQVVFLLLMILMFLVSGRMVLKALKIETNNAFIEAVLCFGIGTCAWTVFLWICAVAGILNSKVGWAAVILVLLLGYMHARYWLLKFLQSSFEVKRPWYSFTLLCAWLLISFLAFNFLTVIRPFPIGWDDLGSYLNRPRLLISYGSFISSMSAFQWEYLSSMGYLLYGYDSIFGSTAAMLINWMAGLFATLTVMVFARAFLGAGTGVISGLLYYILPLIGHFSFADMKTDNAVFAYQALSILCLFIFLYKKPESEESEEQAEESSTAVQRKPLHIFLLGERWQWLLLSGAFCAFAFGTKPTALMVAMTLGAILLGSTLHWSAFIGVVIFSFALFAQGVLNVDQVAVRVGLEGVTKANFTWACLALSAVFLVYAGFRSSKQVIAAVRQSALLIIGFLVCIAPWVIHNNLQYGYVLPRLILTAPDKITPVLDITGTVDPTKTLTTVRSLPPELQVDRSNSACVATAREEELGRYWGFRQGWGHYLTLPWRSVMNIDSAGYYVTTSPALLLFPLLLLLPFFWMKKGRWIRWLFAGTIFLVVLWVFLANGVPWYGIGMFLGLTIGLEILLVRAPDQLNRIAAGTLICFAIVSCFAMRFWQFEQQRNLLEYAMGKASAATMRERTIPHYDDITSVVLQRHEQLTDRPYLYRVGTFIPYFIPKNLEIIGTKDHQLDMFNCLNQERDNALTLKRLRALGFNSIIFDTNTATIEKDVNGSLHKKVGRFVDFLNDPSLGLQVIINDPKAGVAYILIP